MNFNKFLTDFTDHLNTMLSSTPTLFEVELTPDDRTVLYNLYLDSFPPEHNKLFRERSIFHFYKAMGNGYIPPPQPYKQCDQPNGRYPPKIFYFHIQHSLF